MGKYRVHFDVCHVAEIEIEAASEEAAARKALRMYREDAGPFTENWWLDIRPSAHAQEVAQTPDEVSGG